MRTYSLGATSSAADAVDLDGFTILPGLIDAHSHLGLVAQPLGTPSPLAIVAAQIFRNARLALSEGFTTMRDVGGVDGGLAQAINQGFLVGPRILPSGPMISQSGGHGDWRSPFDHGAWEVGAPGLVQPSVLADGPDEMRRIARMALRDGATQLKVALSGGFSSDCDYLDDLQFDVDELRAAVTVARGHHTYVTAHAHHAAAVRLGLEAGVECFEHGTFLDAETVHEVYQRHGMLVATLSAVSCYQDPQLRAQLRPDLEEGAREAFPAMSRMVQMAVEAGITVGSGSDQVGPEQTLRGREVAVRARVTSPREAVYAATGANSKILRLDGETGVLRPGMAADVTVVAGNPAEEPELFEDPSRVRLVLHGGRICKNTLPDSLATEVAGRFA
ncbi:MAG: metal-dependent hydrolase family protein [Candidatus Dormibacteria bacterium]